MFVRARRKGLRPHCSGHNGCAVHREDEVGRRQDEDSRPPSCHDLLWRARFASLKFLSVACSELTSAFPLASGDTVQFAEFIERNLRLRQIRTNQELRPQAAASWIRRELAQSLRSRSPYAVNLLVGGVDVSKAALQENEAGEPKLYWIDYLGTMAEVPFAAHGYGSYFALSLLDRCVSLPLMFSFPGPLLPRIPYATFNIPRSLLFIHCYADITIRMRHWKKAWKLSKDVSRKCRNVLLWHHRSIK